MVRIGEREISAMAAWVGMEERDFIEAYTELRPGRDGLALKNRANGECVFLEGRDCRVQGAKPEQCKGFPNAWNFPGWRAVCEAVPRLVGAGGSGRREGERGFTLLELCMALMVALLMLAIAVPSVSGVLAERRLRDRMVEFEAVVRTAAQRARESGAEVRLQWLKGGLGFQSDQVAGPSGGRIGAEEKPVLVFEFEKDERFELKRVAARDKSPAPEWSFWPAGLREPVEVAYSGNKGWWVLRFGAVSPDPDLVLMRTP
ncbi:MAG: hypothetical protein RLZZ244_821 [Verrucomicrobiota bacterium]|jgi:prepilin-type N-terminal cleavage/methylation domain-containing protein